MFNFDDFVFDFDGDGTPDFRGEEFDADGDGFNESILVDTDGDGVADAMLTDTDGDGVMDATWLDTDGDGVFDTALVDTDGDGTADAVLTDTNGDGIIDTMQSETDTDGDGYADTMTVSHDYDQDGTFESTAVYRDMDGDGVYDELVKGYDSDHDGKIDTFTTYQDLDGDGHADAVVQEQYFDRDGDGNIDTYVFQTDGDGDGAFDAIQVYDVDPATHEVHLIPLDDELGHVAGTYADELEQFDPAHADMDAVSGDPARAMEQWEFQGNTGRCALYSQKFVIEEITGQEVDIEEMADLAEENGWFDEDHGTPLLNMNKMLDHYGIENTMRFHNDISDIERCLGFGGKIIVSIDADEIWYGENDNLFTPGDGANHAVEVIGIDHSNPDEPMVILNDSGNPNGCGEMVPMDTFLDAWEDGDCQMITCL